MFEVELSPIDLGDVRDQGRGVLSVLLDESSESLEEAALVENAKCFAVDHKSDANMGG